MPVPAVEPVAPLGAAVSPGVVAASSGTAGSRSSPATDSLRVDIGRMVSSTKHAGRSGSSIESAVERIATSSSLRFCKRHAAFVAQCFSLGMHAEPLWLASVGRQLLSRMGLSVVMLHRCSLVSFSSYVGSEAAEWARSFWSRGAARDWC